ncbi:MAG: M20/M25/M40 family metallo-hydrolase [Acidobacteria bacterium]|nr:M20/M25/M40 family metallo-hydrolase [Acidobacteriota bacterium]
MRLFLCCLLAWPTLCVAQTATDLEILHRRAQPVAYVSERLGPEATVDATGSAAISYGNGSPHTLLVAGIDQPGYAVSGVTEDGYLRLQRLAEPPPSYQFDGLWQGQPVEILRWGRSPLPGVILAPSVHFAGDRGASTGGALDRLYVDIGAASADEVAAAGVTLLDRVRLRQGAVPFGREGLAGPWLSSQAGAAVLLALADRWRQNPPAGRVTLVFADQQHYHNAGLLRTLRRFAAEPPDRIVALRPTGNDGLEGAAASPGGDQILRDLIALGRERSVEIHPRATATFSFGPFETASPWPAPAAAVNLGPANAGSSAEYYSWEELGQATGLLAAFAGDSSDTDWTAALRRHRPAPAEQRPTSPPDPLFDLLSELIEAPGVSGDEGAVRELIQQRLPAWARERSETDEAGNLIVRLGRGDEPKAVFIAHMDEIGFRISRIDATGRIAVDSRGGLSDELFAFRPLILRTPNGARTAWMERAGSVRLGPGLQAEAEALGAEVGQTLTPPKKLIRLLGERINGRSLDDRAGCAALLLALLALDGNKLAAEGAPVWFVFSSEEEVGLLGAEAFAKAHPPERVYAVDSLVTSDSPLEPKRLGYLRLGDGAALRALDNSGLTPRAAVEDVLALARQAQIPVQIGVTAGGNDGSKFTQYGAVNIPLSFPLRSSHTSAETADLRDLRALTALVELLANREISSR